MVTDFDTKTLLPVQKYSYWFDLDKANADGQPTWNSHDYLDWYKMPDLSPASHMDVANRIKND